MLARLALVSSLIGSVVAAQDNATRPNFVFFLVDDLGWRDLGCTGSTFYETPNIDALAASGMRFTQAYASCPVCSPTRASIMAGKYPARMKTTNYFSGRRKGKLLPAEFINRLPLEEVTIAEALREAGYRTAFFGKWHLGGEGYHPTDQGFDSNVAGFKRGHPPAGYFSPYKMPTLSDGPKGEHLTERLTDEALKFLGRQGEDPFLLYMSYYTVHTPLQSKPEYARKYREKRDAMPKRPEADYWKTEGRRRARQIQDHAVYAGMVESLDVSVGRILDALREQGLAENTVVLFTSDNGGLSTSEGSPTSNVPLRAGKGWLYEGGIREPMIVRWPGVTAAGSTCDVPVISNDFYPTMLTMASLPARPDQHVDGRDLSALLRGGKSLDRDALYWHYPHYGNQGGSPGGAVRVGRHKLIEFYEDNRVELYDLAADEGEMRDLAQDEPATAKKLRAMLHTWRDSVDAEMPRPNPNHGKRKGKRKKKR